MYSARIVVGTILLVAVIFFLAGVFVSRQPNSAESAGVATPGSKILYYRCPMHPSFKSDRAGNAPCCGMRFEPVYAEGHGVIQLSTERQQLTGIRMAVATRSSGTRTLRVLGRVAPDEARTYRLNASGDWWIRRVSPATTGSMVRKDEPLLSFYTPAFRPAAQGYLYTLAALDKQKAEAAASKEQIASLQTNLRPLIEGLQNLGVSDSQIEEMERTRTISALVDLRSPVAGILLSRNASPAQYVGTGTELYRIADISRVWVLADLFENEAQDVRPVRSGMVYSQGRKLPAAVSNVLPQIDPSSRTLKLRLEVNNPGYILRPDMFVDVELLVSLPPAVTVPADAVLDSGRQKTVFVERSSGVFERRTVMTGWHADHAVAVTHGLQQGERVVVSGQFLLDSEARMRGTGYPALQGTPAK